MLLPSHIRLLVDNYDDLEYFKSICFDLEIDSTFDICDFAEEILNEGYHKILEQLFQLITFLQTVEIYSELTEKIIWLSRVIKKKYKEAFLEILIKMALEEPFSILPTSTQIEIMRSSFAEANYKFLTEEERNELVYSFIAQLEYYFLEMSEEEILNKNYENIFDEITALLDSIYSPEDLLSNEVLKQAIRFYKKTITDVLKQRKKCIRESRKEQQRKEMFLKKNYSNYMKGQEMLSCCSSIIEEQMAGSLGQPQSIQRKRALTKKKDAEIDPNQLTLFS